MTIKSSEMGQCPPTRRGRRNVRFPLKLSLVAMLALLVCCGREASGADKRTYSMEKEERRNKKRLLGLGEKRAQMRAEREKFMEMRRQGVDEVSNTEDSVALRNYQLRKKKRKGLLKRKEASLASVLFPGVSPENYEVNEPVVMYVDLVESKKTQVPFKYYNLPHCKLPPKTNLKNRMRKNLGSKLQGRIPLPAPYELNVKQNRPCTPICEVKVNSAKVRWMRKLIERQYRIHLALDNLPVLMRNAEHNYAVRGYPVGFKAPEEYFLFNHLKFKITYHEDPQEFDGTRITGFDVSPVSIKHVTQQGQLDNIETCNAPGASEPTNNPDTYLALRTSTGGESLKVVYSYDVTWEQSDLTWADRWDVYLIGSPDDDIHYFAIVNSLMIVIFLTGAVATIMIRTLRKDIAAYNEMQTLEEAQEETGWKLLHGDVFRPPRFRMLLSVAVGTGAQIGAAFFCTMLCAMVGFLNPMNKGQTLTSIIVLYVLCGSVAGYVSSRLYKYCDAKAWKRNTVITAAAFPGVLVSMFIVLNVFLTFAGAATAVSVWTIIALFLLWVCVSTPLVFVGSFFGFRANKIEVPTKTNQIARFIPEPLWYTHPALTVIMGGTLPFGSVCIEMFFIMSALWLHQIYYVMGFLLAVLLIVAATCAEVSVVMCYLQLCAEDHRWWWKSFFNCASAGMYLFLYSVWFLSSKLDLVGFLPVMVYLTYMSMISISFALVCGTVGLLSCFWFTRRIYGAVKVD